jgi:hypothetical protein
MALSPRHADVRKANTSTIWYALAANAARRERCFHARIRQIPQDRNRRDQGPDGQPDPVAWARPDRRRVGPPDRLAELAERLGLTRSTTHRLASALIDRRFLIFTPRQSYRLGPKLLELGFLAQQQADVVQIGRDHIEALAAASEDTVHLGVRDGDKALHLDKIPGRRRVDISSRVGDRQPMTSTGLGKALMLDDEAKHWQPAFRRRAGGRSACARL